METVLVTRETGYRRHVRVWLCSVLIAGVFAAPALCSSVNVPLDHWSYRAIDILIGFGAIHTAMVGTKPFSRDEMARLIVEAMPRIEELPYRQRRLANRLLKRLLRTFQDEVNSRTGNEAPSTFLKPLDDVSAQYVHLDGQPTRMLPTASIDATEGTPLVRNNEGIDYQDGENFLLTTTSYAKLWDRFSFFVQPLFTLHGGSGDSVDADARLHKGYLKAHLGPFEFEFGRDAIRWGQGYRGTLVFSNHARPLDFLQISTPHPVTLPWIFKHLGLTKWAIFVAQLEKDRDVSRAKLVGMRLQIKPFRWLEFGVVSGVLFDDWDDFIDALDILPGRGSKDKTDQLAALDLRITLPFLRHTEIYFEYGGEDRGGFDYDSDGLRIFYADVAFLVGLYIPRLTDDGRTTFRFEWMQNTFANDDTPTVWYTHGIFTSGFTFKRRVLGHATGGDSAEYFWRLTRDFSDRFTMGLDFAYRWRGDQLLSRDNSKARERHYAGGLDLQYFFTDLWEVRARFAVERVENFNLQPGEDETNAILWLHVRYHFL